MPAVGIYVEIAVRAGIAFVAVDSVENEAFLASP